MQADVIIPYYTDTQWLPNAIDSILQQEGVNCFIHCVNDCSPENDDWIRTKYANTPRIYWYRNEENIGPYMSVHGVFPALKTQYIIIQDSDDLSVKDRAKISLEALQDGARIVSGNMIQFIRAGCSMESRHIHKNSPIIRSGLEYRDIQADIIPRKMIHGTVCMEKSLFEELNGYCGDRFGCDLEFIGRCFNYCQDKCRILNTILGYRGVSTQSLSLSEETGMKSDIRKEQMHKFKERFSNVQFPLSQYGVLT